VVGFGVRDPGSAPDVVASVLGAIGSQSGGGRFEFDKQEMAAVHAEWQAVAKELFSLQRDSLRLLEVGSPADDVASNAMVVKAAQSFAVYKNDLVKMQRYADGYAEKIGSALEQYERDDQGAATDVGQQDR
jgi:hypothetical protein